MLAWVLNASLLLTGDSFVSSKYFTSVNSSNMLFIIKDTLKFFEDFKNKQKSVSITIFWDVKVRLFWKYI